MCIYSEEIKKTEQKRRDQMQIMYKCVNNVRMSIKIQELNYDIINLPKWRICPSGE